MTVIIVLAVLVVAAIYTISMYNGLITLKNRVKEAWSDIQVQLKRRYDLIPNLVETVKGYAAHESGTLEKVIKARNMAISASGASIEEQAAAANQVASTLKSLFALSESYPDLKANTNFLELQKELSDTENRLQAARSFYNTNVNAFNTTIEKFPNNIIANTFHFQKAALFELDSEEAAAAKKAPQVKF